MRFNSCVFLPATGAENAIVSPHIHRTWEGYFSPALYKKHPEIAIREKAIMRFSVDSVRDHTYMTSAKFWDFFSKSAQRSLLSLITMFIFGSPPSPQANIL